MESVDEIDDRIRRWMAEQSKRQGYSRSGLARFAGLETTVPSKITRGERIIKAGEYVLARRYFGNDPFSETIERPSKKTLKFIEAGTFKELERIEQGASESLPQSVMCPPHLEAFQVRGDGMDNLKPRPILDGDFVLCEPIRDNEPKLKTGDVVIVDLRAAPSLDIWERVLNRVSVDPVKTTLKFCSAKLKRDSIAYDGQNSSDLRLVGIVRAIITPMN